jgi:thioredoxin reductase (NADPH)
MPEITLYGAPWCPDCKRSKQFLAQHRVAFNWVDIDQDREELRYVERLQQAGAPFPRAYLGRGIAFWSRPTRSSPKSSASR